MKIQPPSRERSTPMELTLPETGGLNAYLDPFFKLAGDQRTARLLAGTVRGLVGSESPVCARIAALLGRPAGS